MSTATVAIVAGVTANTILLLAAMSMWFSHRSQRARRREQLDGLGERLERRLEELGRAVDVIAIEVERISESQRYLMFERGATRPGSSDAPPQMPERVITPH